MNIYKTRLSKKLIKNRILISHFTLSVSPLQRVGEPSLVFFPKYAFPCCYSTAHLPLYRSIASCWPNPLFKEKTYTDMSSSHIRISQLFCNFLCDFLSQMPLLYCFSNFVSDFLLLLFTVTRNLSCYITSILLYITSFLCLLYFLFSFFFLFFLLIFVFFPATKESSKPIIKLPPKCE